MTKEEIISALSNKAMFGFEHFLFVGEQNGQHFGILYQAPTASYEKMITLRSKCRWHMTGITSDGAEWRNTSTIGYKRWIDSYTRIKNGMQSYGTTWHL